MSSNLESNTRQLIDAGRALHALGMVPATSGNFSARLDDGTIAITVSGAHKGHLTPADIMLLDGEGQPLDDRRPSAETGLHLQLYRHFPGTGAILHPHSMAATLTRGIQQNRILLRGYELLKAFEGITTHQSELSVPVYDNSQDIPALAAEVAASLDAYDYVRAYIIRGHGFYTWAADVPTALRHCEALEFLLQCEFRLNGLTR